LVLISLKKTVEGKESDNRSMVLVMSQVLNYDDFISKPLSMKLSQLSLLSSRNGPCNINGNSAAVHNDNPEHHVPPIAILNASMTGIGPEQCEVMQVQPCFIITV
jgi:hypothetical protein